MSLQTIQGDQDEAIEIVESLDKKDILKRRLSYVTRGDAILPAEEQRLLEDLQPALRAMYAGDPSAAEVALGQTDIEAPFVHFYRGEVELLRGREEFALGHFEAVTNREQHPRWWFYESLARVRSAEVHAAMGDDGAAQKSLRGMIDTHPVKDLLRHIARARKRYYENGRPGASTGAHAAKIPGPPPSRSTSSH